MTRLGLVALLLGCACTTGPGEITGATACRGTAVASVTPGVTPVITWQPECTIGYLAISDLHGVSSWVLVDSGFATTPLNGIMSSVTYGVTPPEARVFVGDGAPLAPHQPYLLVLRVLDDRGGHGLLVDTLTFVP